MGTGLIDDALGRGSRKDRNGQLLERAFEIGTNRQRAGDDDWPLRGPDTRQRLIRVAADRLRFREIWLAVGTVRGELQHHGPWFFRKRKLGHLAEIWPLPGPGTGTPS